LLGEKVAWNLDSVVEVAESVEETALLVCSKVDGTQSRAQAAATIVDDKHQSILTSNALFFQDTEKGDPLLVILCAAQRPQQDLRPITFRPNPHGHEDRELVAALHCLLVIFAVTTYLPIRT
jgi:hypothetical protein